MLSIELTTNADEVRNHVWRNDNVVLHKRGHRRFFELFDHFGCTDDGLAQPGIFHVKAFEFCFLLGQQIERRLVHRLNCLGFFIRCGWRLIGFGGRRRFCCRWFCIIGWFLGGWSLRRWWFSHICFPFWCR